MFRLMTAALSCAACVAMTSVADAQIVRVGRFGGGVSIRAPFVSVDVLPFGGGTRVRAPFTSVNTGVYGYGYGGRYPYAPYGGVVAGSRYRGAPVYPTPVYPTPVYPTPSYSTPAYPQSNDYQAARPSVSNNSPERLRASAQQLINSLSARRDDGDVWLDYLSPNRIIETIDRGGSPESLRTLLTHYDGVVGNSSLSSISRASGFRETHELLRDFVQGRSAGTNPNVNVAPSAPVAAPAPARAPGVSKNEPARAAPVKPADDGGNKEELEELPLPPVPTPI